MLEIIALIFLTRKVGDLAKTKGLKPGTWKIYTVLAWFGLEFFVGFVIGLTVGMENIVVLALFGVAAGFLGYLIVLETLKRKPDVLEDELDDLASHLD